GRTLSISTLDVGCGSSSGSGPLRRPARRVASLRSMAAVSSLGRTIALTVRKVSPPLRQIDSSGKDNEAGASDDQGEEPPPSGSKAKPPTQTAPAPAGK